MKRVKAGCIYQTLCFMQKTDLGLSKEQALEANRAEIVRYKRSLDRSKTRYRITREEIQADGSVLMWVKKQLNERTDVDEYFTE